MYQSSELVSKQQTNNLTGYLAFVSEQRYAFHDRRDNFKTTAIPDLPFLAFVLPHAISRWPWWLFLLCSFFYNRLVFDVTFVCVQTQADVQSTMGVLFFVAINQGILGTIGVLQVTFMSRISGFSHGYSVSTAV